MIIPHWPIYTGPNKDFAGAIERTKSILAKLGNPQNKMKNIIHITGTKGKGSTALYISNILLACGYKVNTYTSPHIFECNERILINGKMITDEELLEATEAVRYVCEEGEHKENPIEPAMFEAMTCSAFLLMSKHEADFNIIEVGMGAVNDATNVFDDNPPIACVFTPIHIDHKKFLGSSVEEVAYHKSFLMKRGVKNVILSSQCKEAKQVIKDIASDLGIRNVYAYKEDYEAFLDEKTRQPIYESETFDTCFPFAKPNMSGDYQLVNCACAITTCLACQNDGIAEKLILDAINEGISKTINIVRMQKITNEKIIKLLPKESIFYVDGAHNQLASHALAEWIKEFKQNNQDFKIVVAVARTKGADNEAFLKEFLEWNRPITDLLIATRANLESIPEPPEKIEEAGKNLGFYTTTAYTIKEVVEKTASIFKNSKVILICTGSLYIARDINVFMKHY